MLFASLAMLAGACASPGKATPTATAPATPTIAPSPLAPPTRTPTPGPAGHVTLWLSWDPDELRGLHRVLNRFADRYPEIEFSLAYYDPEAMIPALEAAHGTDAQPGIVLGPSAWGPILWGRGWLADLSTRVDDNLQRDLHPAAWSQSRYQGALVGLPLELQGTVLFRNADLVPGAAGTVTDYVEASRALRESGASDEVIDLGWPNAAPQIWTCGGAVFDDQGRSGLQSDAGACWLGLMEELGRAGRIVFRSDEDLNLFQAGSAGWLMETSDKARALQEALGASSLKVDAWPRYAPTDRTMTGFVWTENAYIIEGASVEDAEAGWAFLRFLVSSDAQEILSDPKEARHLPVLTSLDPADPLMNMMASFVRVGVPLPLRTDLARFYGPLEGAIEDVARQGIAPERAIEIAVEKLATPQPSAAAPTPTSTPVPQG